MWCLNIQDPSSSVLFFDCFDPENGSNKLLWNVINCESGWSHSLEDLNTFTWRHRYKNLGLQLKAFDTLNTEVSMCEMPAMQPTPIHWHYQNRPPHYHWITTKARNYLQKYSILISRYFSGSIDDLDGAWEHAKDSVFSYVILQFPHW